MCRLYATTIALRCPGCGLTRESERAPWDPPAAARYDLHCGRCATGGKTGGIGTYRDEDGREIFEGGRGEMIGMKRYTAEEIGAWSDAAVLHEAVGIVRGMAPDERRTLVARFLRADDPAERAEGAEKPALCGPASYAALHAPHPESCICSWCEQDRLTAKSVARLTSSWLRMRGEPEKADPSGNPRQ